MNWDTCGISLWPVLPSLVLVISAESWDPGREQQLGSVQINLSELSKTCSLRYRHPKAEALWFGHWAMPASVWTEDVSLWAALKAVQDKTQDTTQGCQTGTLGSQLSHILKWVSAVYLILRSWFRDSFYSWWRLTLKLQHCTSRADI